MDDKCLEKLEFNEIIKIIAGYTSFSVARERVLNLKPIPDYHRIFLWLQQTQEARHLLSADNFSFSEASDIREVVRLATLGRIIEPASLIEIQRTLAVMRQARTSLSTMSREVPLLCQIANGIIELPDVERDITHCISPNGAVLDRASPKLATIRAQLVKARQTLVNRLQDIIKTPKGQKIIQEPIITEREGRFVIPVKAEHRSEIQGITHDISNTGATLFVEPLAMLELGNSIRELLTEEKREVERVLQDLSMEVSAYETEILASISQLAELDLALAKARYARTVNATVPKLANFSDNLKEGSYTYIKLVDARHPLLGQKAVPLSVELGRDFLGLVITGPNTGGKTVALKTLGLLSLMTQAGIPIPASPQSCIPVFDGVFTDIGDEQSIERTISSFSWHIGNIIHIITAATSKSLVLLDELGTSTDPVEGSALACSILRHFLSRGILTAATTHYRDLKIFAHTTPGLQNASFDFDPITLTPTYRMTLGIPGGSNALTIAERLGLPNTIINDARNILSKSTLDMDTIIADLRAEKQKMTAARELLEKETLETRERNAELEIKLSQLKAEEQRVIQEARDKVVLEIAELQKEIRQANSELRKKRTREAANMAKQALLTVQARLDTTGQTHDATLPAATQTLVPGDTVNLKDLNLQGTVLSISKEKQEAEIQAGQIKLKVGTYSLEKASGRPTTLSTMPAQKIRAEIEAVPTRLDLRGKRADEVEVVLDSYLNTAMLANLDEVIIIHGTGTGTVRQIVRDFLAIHPLVKAFRAGKQEEGANGVTVASL